MTFRDLNLNSSLLNALDDLGIQQPTTIQQRAFSVIMSGQDVCGIAQTGTGKTFAYLLPTLRLFKFSKEKHPQMLILVPTRELVVQVVESIKKLTTYMSVEVLGLYGGVNMNPQMAAAKEKTDIIVATPGRLYDVILSGAVKMKGIKRLVIDEMDEMLNLGFRTQIQNIMDLLPERRQNLLFSATITEDVEKLIETHFENPARIEAAPAGTPLENIDQRVYRIPNFNTKLNLLKQLITQDVTMTKTLIFTGTKALADELYTSLNEQFPEKIGVIHSNKEQNHRFNTVNQFQAGNYRFLIATDIIARGLDIAEVTHVINFDTPDVPENYIHRIGRTGRADKKGIAILLTKDSEVEQLAAIEGLMNYQIPEVALPADLEISDVLTEEEKPKVQMRNILVKMPKLEDFGPAFHEKLAKNQKVNKKVSHTDKMMLKYGKPKKRGAKPKRKR
ncbi:ATP-dependent RNA helicase RhlE [Chitinophaga jiangningensis]|uniref:ATP-dependent RNA helicase RhlE n=1 Tax=Chitinophaga jiangningensis TaxID=1419482 RepID=A0A1M7MYS7_9BACT|nr:DEAD/DEAH box helicase [Chitinophaga jiangningensis]SHM95804.1 ATP-dependent RNA helicase RhlE [Chitinophaga jiangningensis]